MKKLEKLMVGIVSLPVCVFVTFLLHQSIFLTMADTENVDVGHEKGFVVSDQPLLHLLVFLALALLAVLLVRFFRAHPVPRKASLALTVVLAGAGVFFLVSLVTAGQLHPAIDPAAVHEAAKAFCEGDLSALTDGGYLTIYPFQKGLLLYEILLVRLFGENAFLAVQYMDIFWFTLSCVLLAVFAHRTLAPQKTRLCGVYLVCAVWYLPLALYTTFCYGTISGLAFGMLACVLLLHFVKSGSPAAGVAGAFCAALASLLKENYLIFCVALVIYLSWQALRNKRWQPLAVSALIAVFFALLSLGADQYLYRSNGLPVPEGQPTITWVAMGLNDGEAMEGWSCAVGPETQAIMLSEGQQAAKEYAGQSVKASLERMAADPLGALRFFARKTNAQWNMPTYMSLYVNRNRTSAQTGGESLPAKLFGVGRTLPALYTAAANLLLTQIWAWMLVWFFLNRKTLRLPQLFLAVIFLGGALFHLVWEAKAEYAVVYVFLMLPYAITGLAQFGGWAAQAVKKAPRVRLRPTAATATVGVVAALFLLSSVTGRYFTYTKAEAQQALAESREWTQQRTAAPLQGQFYLYNRQSGRFLNSNEGIEGASASLGDTAGSVLTVEPFLDSYITEKEPDSATRYCYKLLNSLGETLGLSSYDGKTLLSPKPGARGDAWNQRWYIWGNSEEGYVLFATNSSTPDFALTAVSKSGELILEPYTGEAAQRWVLAPIGE